MKTQVFGRLVDDSCGHSFRNLLLLILGILALAVISARGDLEVGASVQIHAKAEFEAPLATHGTWVEVGSYGRCWRPGHVAVGWRPYCSGSWVWTDSGWYWASDEPWAWACYHYGRWVYDGEGWVWVPGVEWAPAWVSWRVGGGHIGWAPMTPVGWVSVRVGAPSLYVFVGSAHFTGPIRPSGVIVNNNAIFKESKALNNASHETRNIAGAGSQKVVVNHGPSVAMVEKAGGRSIKQVPIREATARTHAPKEVAQKGSSSGGSDKGSKQSYASGNDQQGGKEARAGGGGPDREGGKPERGGWGDGGGSRESGGGRGGFFGGGGGGGGRGGGHGKGR